MPTDLWLCQDCLRAVVPTDESRGSGGVAGCPCGGELCWCESRTLRRLQAGERGTLDGLLRVPIASWTPDGGCVVARQEGT